MRRFSLNPSLIATALLLLAPPAFAVPAPGLNLAWTTCASQGGTANLDFACTDDFAQLDLAMTFVLAATAPGVTGIEIVVDLISATPTLPAWWDFASGGCGAGNLFARAAAPAGTLCTDWALGAADGGLAAYSSEGGSVPPQYQSAHRKVIMGFAVAAPRDLQVATEYEAGTLWLYTSHTVAGPPGPCGGCSTPVCIVLNSMNVVEGTSGATRISAPSAVFSNQVTWQGGLGANCSAVPVKNATWGHVKALYR
ncbi:MAG TPA: hypothetical protein VI504_07675 [Candidatus Eisenbacteria bacterium]